MTTKNGSSSSNPIVDYSLPLYVQVEATLQEMIEDTEYGPGDQIPSERELSELLGVSRMTVRRAIENLISQGLLERRSTYGTYVRSPQVVRPVGMSHTQSISQMLAGKATGAELLHFEQMRAPRKVAAMLQLRVGEHVFMIRRLRTAEGVPFCVETAYLPARLVPGLSAVDLRKNASLYQLLRERYGIIPDQSDGELRISRCLPDEAEWLNLSIGDPVLFLKTRVVDVQGQPFEYMKSVNHPERVVFEIQRKH